MSIWDSFNDEELFTILECDNFKDIKKRVARRFDKSEWIAAARNMYRLDKKRMMSPGTIFGSLQDAASASLLVLLSVIGSITVAFLPLTIMTAVLAVVGMASGVFLMAVSYLKEKDKIKHTIKKLDFNAIKILCADEIVKRKKVQLASSMAHRGDTILMPKMISDDEARFEYKSKNKIQKSATAVIFGLLTGAAFFSTYYCGLAIVLNAFGALAASAAMLGPIGMSVALAAAIGIGIFCAYQHYQSNVRNDKVTQYKDFQKAQIKDRRWDCYTMADKTRQLSSRKAIATDHQVDEQHDTVDKKIVSQGRDQIEISGTMLLRKSNV